MEIQRSPDTTVPSPIDMDPAISHRWHPVVVLVSLLLILLTVMNARMGSASFVGALLVVVILARADRQSPGRFLKALLRLRWILFSIVILHGFLTPGTPLLATVPWLTLEGILMGGQQIVRLVIMLLAALVLMRLFTPWQLLGQLMVHHEKRTWFCYLISGWQRFVLLTMLAILLLGGMRRRAGNIHQAWSLRADPGAKENRVQALGDLLQRYRTLGTALLISNFSGIDHQADAFRVRGIDRLDRSLLPQAGVGCGGHTLPWWWGYNALLLLSALTLFAMTFFG